MQRTKQQRSVKTQARNSTMAIGVACALVIPSAHAGGISVPGSGPEAQARAGAVVAKADDPSAVVHNPAGIAKTKGTVLLIGANFVDYSLSFSRSGSYEAPIVGADPYPTVTDQSSPAVGLGGFQAIPMLMVASDLGGAVPGFAVGGGISAPHGFPERDLASSYQFEDPTENPPPNRYDMVTQEVAVVFASFGAAYSFEVGRGTLSLGANAAWGIAEVKAFSYIWGQRNYEEDVRADGNIRLDTVDAIVPRGRLGVLYKPTSNFEFGASYTSRAAIRSEGTGVASLGSATDELGLGVSVIPQTDARKIGCAPGGTIAGVKACVNFNLPQEAGLGARYIISDKSGAERGDVEFDVRWENWAAASNFEIIVDGIIDPVGLELRPTVVAHGFRDTWSARLGGSYSVPAGPGSLTFRAGAAYDTAAAPLKWQRVSLDGASKTTFSGGIAWANDRFAVEAGAGVVIQPTRDVPTCNPSVGDPACDLFESGGVSPSPLNPVLFPSQQEVSPFNGGTYKSGYVLMSLGTKIFF